MLTICIVQGIKCTFAFLHDAFVRPAAVYIMSSLPMIAQFVILSFAGPSILVPLLKPERHDVRPPVHAWVYIIISVFQGLVLIVSFVSVRQHCVHEDTVWKWYNPALLEFLFTFKVFTIVSYFFWFCDLN